MSSELPLVSHHPGKGGPEKQALEHLKDLGKRQDRQVGIASLIGIDVLDQKHDKTDRKIDFVSTTQTTLLSSQTTIINQVTQMKQMLKEKQEDKTGPKSKRIMHARTVGLTKDRNN
jgi:hypothetical protein